MTHDTFFVDNAVGTTFVDAAGRRQIPQKANFLHGYLKRRRRLWIYGPTVSALRR